MNVFPWNITILISNNITSARLINDIFEYLSPDIEAHHLGNVLAVS